MEQQERRAPDARRVPITTLVEICGQETDVPNFEAESVEVSGRGMHVKTAYVPSVGAPLVCRFEDGGREIIVEGVVAWRQDDPLAGEFGIRFTALDAGSVEALRELCGVSIEPSPAPPEASDPDGGASPAPAQATSKGTRVRLHIDGLGSPMKARVKNHSTRRVDVGSNLEFLKVGKRLEIEDLGAGEKRGATIDSVTVTIDPGSRIPQLVVTLRYEGVEDTTPEPTVIGADDHEFDGEDDVLDAPRASAEGHPASPAEEAEFDEDDGLADMKGPVGRFAVAAGSVMTTAGSGAAKLSSKAFAGLGRLLVAAKDRVGTRVEALRDERGSPRVRRTTAPPPSGALSSRLKRQSTAPASATVSTAPEGGRSKRRVVAGAAALSLLLAGSVYAFSGSGDPPGAAAEASAGSTEAVSTDVVAVNEHGDPVAAAPAAAPAAAAAQTTPAEPPLEGEGDQGAGVTANVPLFGPTPMATLEPAPLAPPGTASEAADEAPAASQQAAVDEVFEDSPEAAPAAPKVDPSSVPAFTRGTVRTPTIHRLRLDAAGAKIQGAVNPTGFTIVVPDRKVMESGTAIAKRDERIAAVRTRNTSSGAQVAFQFKNGVPGYKVRLRRDCVEFLISAPAPKKSSPKKSSKKSSKQP